MKTYLILGLGISGRGAANFLLKKGVKLLGVDKKKIEGLGFPAQLESDPIDFATIEKIILSPGIPLSHSIVVEANRRGIPVIGEVELAFESMDNRAVGITGTNGKTTVTLLVAHILKNAGIKARALGNVGEPLTSFQPSEVIVAELSSYQLESMKSKKLDAGLILNITPDHLDRYASMDDYALAKFKMANCLKENAPLFIQEKAFLNFGHLLKYPKIVLLKEDIDLFSHFPYNHSSGHDKENLMGAFALCHHLGISRESFINGVSSFKKPPHRIQFIRELRGVKYFDDSKGTNLDAVIAAVQSMEGNVVLIAGGVDKGARYTPWIQSFQGKVKAILTIGQAGEKIAKDLSDAFDIQHFKTLNSAVSHACKLACSGESVLLSPGCSSFDMFCDYADRGRQFQQAVNALGEENEP
jgi:UDP-N-acetylmuramoylalanine--D-glutamate ligase